MPADTPPEQPPDRNALQVVAAIQDADDDEARRLESEAVEQTDKTGTAAEEKASAELDQTPGPPV